MDSGLTLVEIYLFICKRSARLEALAGRRSNNSRPAFTDEEVLTIYLFGLFKKRKSVRQIYDYTAEHFSSWFPDLPSYKSYNRRLNRLSAAFAPLVGAALSKVDCQETRKEAMRIADSMPIMLAKEKRSSRAKVASRLADKGYCSSKSTHFYGVKMHVVAQRRSGQLYGDKAYCDGPMKERLEEKQNLTMRTPVKRKKGQEHLSAADKLFSKAVSKVRQPIESLFNWIDEKTGIQRASKVRSYQGLLVHAFGRLAAAMLLLALNP